MTRGRKIAWVALTPVTICLLIVVVLIAAGFWRRIALEWRLKRVSTLVAEIKAHPPAEKEVARLKELASDGDAYGEVTTQALESVGEAGSGDPARMSRYLVPFLVEQSGRATATQSQAICSALGDFGPYGESAVDTIIHLMQKGRWSSVEAICAKALGRIGAHAEKAVPALAALVPNRDPTTGRPNSVRGEEVMALAAFGPRAQGAAASLQKALRDDDIDYRWKVVYALSKIAPESEAIPSAAAALLNTDDRVARYYALLSLQAIPPETLARVSPSIQAAACSTIPEDAAIARSLVAKIGGHVECPE